MPGFIPALTDESLKSLRKLVERMHAQNGKSVPMADLVRLADEVKVQGGLTVDFQASEQLGSPMVVLQLHQSAKESLFLSVLSNREKEVARLIAEGLSNKQIAKQLHISQATVKDHVHSILVKTDLPNRTAVAVAMRS
jgi:two-component system, NarL family, nitrate/nitrite response regulator NarL